MPAISQEMTDVIEEAKLMFVATVRPDGTPNVSPKGSVRVLDPDHLIFMDIASLQTVENLRHQLAIEVNVVDFIARKGFRFRGTAEVLDAGHPDFEWIRAWLVSKHSDSQPTNHAVKIAVSEAAELLSPAYTVDHVPEADVRKGWLRNYGLAEAPSEAGV
ncbi:pyridoxamine 5'-phosphate oxidase family protein [Amycolatopsis sp. NPDC049253]|uniref:pyridoxamine 5'-phosphate oxidase family protein n=1 Tax=Amycolatopsis sp. NPDC049253 TaxID=3155274 RepID=UPI003441DD79